VFPKNIRVSLTESEQAIPLSIRGNVESPVFQSSNPDVVNVDENGVLYFGGTPGNAMIMVWDSPDKLSVRHVAVEARLPSWFAQHPDFHGANIIRVRGMVMDALTSNGIPNATLMLRRDETGPIVKQAITDESGQYEVTLREGEYYYEVSAENYITGSGSIHVSETGIWGENIELAPALDGQVARIVLQWWETPANLDAHLWGPLPNGSRFHVYHTNAHQPDEADLDVNDTTSYGPETIDILRFNPGPYRFYVHNYTNRNANPNRALGQSGAWVKLLLNTGEIYTFYVPYLYGTAWRVFEIDGATGQVTEVNTMFYQSNPALVGS
jgi:hypothetical protein